MSWLYSRALVEEYSEDTCSDGELFAPLSGNPTQLAYLPPDRMTAFSRLSRFGMTFKPLTADRGEELLTLFLEDFRAKTSQQPDEAPVLTESDQGCGHIWRESLAKYDPDTSTWRIAQCSLLEGATEFLGTWPRWGSMRDGVSYQRQPLVRHTKGTGSGLWRTPSAQEPGVSAERLVPIEGGTPGGMNRHFDKHTGRMAQIGLEQQVKLRAMTWPTPNAWDGKRGPRSEEHIATKKGQITLVTAIARWPTPTAHNAKEFNSPSEQQRNTPTLAAQAGGQLNPTWVEWLMGWPLGWTDLKPLEMDKYRLWQQQHGGS
jgi:hypothetical protein